MHVYYIITYDIINAEDFSNYGPKVIPYLSKFGGEVLASDTDGIAVEGKPRTMNAIIKFPSEELALKCYNDPEYLAIKAIRMRSTKNTTMVLVKGFGNKDS
jgi:uncharacterized protein (DUF1330 family)